MTVKKEAPSILVVDDDPGLARLIEKTLHREGFRPRTALSGHEAIAWLTENRADLMLLDLKLQDFEGKDLIDHLAKIGRPVPFLIITGQGDERVAVEMMKSGALDYLVKDVQFLEFIPTVIRRALAHLEKEKRLAAAEEALKKEYAFTSAILNTSGALLLVLDREGRIVHFNHACEAATGYTLDEVRGRKMGDLFLVPEEEAAVRAIYADLRAGKKPGHHENYWRTRDGSRLLIAWTGACLTDRQRQVEFIIGSGLDITERKRAELRQQVEFSANRALAETKEIPEAAAKILESICVSFGWDQGRFWALDRESIKLRPVQTWPGKTKNGESRKTAARLRRGCGAAGLAWDQAKPVWASKEPAESKVFLHSSEGLPRGWQGGCAFPIVFGDSVLGVLEFFSSQPQEPDEALWPMFEAIGSQIGQFIERKRAEEALKKEHAFTAAVLDASGALIVVLDRDRRILRFNRACENATGYSLAQVQGRFVWDLFLASAEVEAVKRTYEKLIATAQPAQHIHHWITKTGERRLIAWSYTPFLQTDGSIEYVIGAGIDITEHKRLEKEILHISEMEQQRIGQDLHDGLCQQLAAIEFMSQVLQEQIAPKSKLHAAAAAEIAKNVRETISQTRDLARGLLPVVLESAGLMSALQELAASTRKRFKVPCSFKCHPPVLVRDNTIATHLYRIAQEAVSNALRHGKADEIEIALQGIPDKIILTVTDNGCGFPARRQRKKGMGLRIMNYRAGMIGASLEVTSQKKQGTTVVCALHKKL